MKQSLMLDDIVGHLLRTMVNEPEIAPKFAPDNSPSGVWSALMFCVLSSQIPFLRAQKATARLSDKIPFFDVESCFFELQSQVMNELASRDIGHRFPRSKAKQIVHSWFAFAQIRDQFHEYLGSFGCERRARMAVMENFPGLGMKQASMLLRDVGFSKRLAIIDTHILWYISHRSGKCVGTITPKKYMEIEDELLWEADHFQVEPNRLDTAIWAAVKAVKANTCTMQFA
jgi:N-glycosylase/DNA lyase